LTAAFALSATGCGNDSQTSSSTANSADSAAQTEESSAAPAENGGAADAADTNVFTYEMRDDGTVTITGYQGAETALDIPSTVDNYVVSAIADHAFEANWDITSVTLPSGLWRRSTVPLLPAVRRWRACLCRRRSLPLWKRRSPVVPV